MMLRFLLSILIFFATGLQAKTLSTSDPDGMLQFFERGGLEARLDKDEFGDPTIRLQIADTLFAIYFYGCEEGSNCSSLQFYAGYRTGGEWPPEQVNIWNRERRFARAYLSDEGHARLEMDIVLSQTGVPEEYFTQVLKIWARNLKQFEEVIGW